MQGEAAAERAVVNDSPQTIFRIIKQPPTGIRRGLNILFSPLRSVHQTFIITGRIIGLRFVLWKRNFDTLSLTLVFI